MLRKPLLGVLLIACLTGCKPDPSMALLGHWNGGFEPDQGAKEYSGYLQIYKTNRTYKLQIDNRTQTILVQGGWEFDGKQVILNVGNVSVDQPSDDQLVGKRDRVIPMDKLREQFGKRIPLSIREEKSAVSPSMQLGSKSGVFRFQNIGRSRY